VTSEHRDDIILFRVLNHEVAFSSYFCNLLKIDEFRELFINFIREKNKILPNQELIKYSNFNTEVTLENNYGRVDLFLEIDNQKFIFEIKHKSYTKLSDGQPHNYLKYLENKNEHLFFLVPKGYKHTQEIIKRWENYNEYEIRKQIFYWQDFIYRIKDIKIREIQIFYEFCELWFNMKPIIFNNDEKRLFNRKGVIVNEFNNISIPKLMTKLIKIVEQIGTNRNMKIWYGLSIDGFYYTKKINDYQIFLGIDYDYWENTGTPLAILIQNHENGYSDFNLNIKADDIELENFSNMETVSSYEYFGFYVNIKDILLEDNYQNKIEDKLLRIEEELKKI